MDDAEEVEVAPGVYITDFRTSNTNNTNTNNTNTIPAQSFASSSPSSISQNCGTELNVAFEVTEIENAIKHLIRSNVELAKAMEEDNDPIYQESIQENLAIIAKKKKHRDELLAQQQRLGR